jgi:tetratricopeptide (TPR) repeat protein
MDYFQRALEMAQRDSNLPTVSFVNGNLGETAARRGHLVEAEEQLRQSLAIAEQVNDPEQAGWVHAVLAGTLCDLGDMTGALSHIRRALKIGRSIKSVLCIGMALVALSEWRITRAIQVDENVLFRPARDLHRRPPVRSAVSRSEKHKEHLSRADSQTMPHATGGHRLLRGAIGASQRALSLEGLNREAAAEARLSLARAVHLSGDVEQAQQIALHSLKEGEQHELLRVIARSERLLGIIVSGLGRDAEADRYFEQALELFDRHEMRLDYARALYNQGVTLLQRPILGGDTYLRGRRCLQEARAIFVECHAPLDVELVERILSDPAYENAGM